MIGENDFVKKCLLCWDAYHIQMFDICFIVNNCWQSVVKNMLTKASNHYPFRMDVGFH